MTLGSDIALAPFKDESPIGANPFGTSPHSESDLSDALFVMDNRFLCKNNDGNGSTI